MMASEMQISYGDYFNYSILGGDNRVFSRDNLIRPAIHGFEFKNMYNSNVKINLKDKIIQAYHFDEA